jgi:hypothetical protein
MSSPAAAPVVMIGRAHGSRRCTQLFTTRQLCNGLARGFGDVQLIVWLQEPQEWEEAELYPYTRIAGVRVVHSTGFVLDTLVDGTRTGHPMPVAVPG